MQVKIIKRHHLKEFLFWYDFALSTRKHIAHFPATIFIFIIFMPIFYCIRKTKYIHTCMLHICTCTYILNWQKTDKTYVYLTMRMICRNNSLSRYFWLLYYCFRSCNKTIQFYLFLTLVYVSTGISLYFYTVLVTNDKWHGCNHQTCFFY